MRSGIRKKSRPRKNIVVVIPTLQFGGAEKVVSLLTKKWAEHRSVVVVCFDGRGCAFSPGGKIIDLKLPANARVTKKILCFTKRVIALRRIFSRFNPRGIVSFMESANYPALFSCAICGMLDRLTISVRTHPSYYSHYQRIFMSIVYRLALRIIVVTKGVKKFLSNDFGLSRNRCFVLPNPLDLSVLKTAANENIQEWRPSQFILSVGRLDWLKGHDTLIKAFALICDKIPEDLVIVGEGESRTELEKIIQALNLRSRVHLIGSRINPWQWMSASSLFVLPSRFEGWPNALAEAMALGCICISFDCESGPREIISDRVDGFLIKKESVTDLAEKILWVLQNRALVDDLAARAEGKMRKFDLGLVSDLYLSVICNSVEKNKLR